MKHMLHFELHRLVRMKSFYICSAVSVIFLFFSCLAGWLTGREVGVFMYTGESVLCGALEMSSTVMILSVFIPILVCEDYEQQTIKNVMARGYSGSTVFYAKLITSALAASVMVLTVFVGGQVFGMIFFETGESTLCEVLKLLGCQYCAVLCYVAFYFFIGMCIRKVGGAIALSFFSPLIISLLLTVANSLLKAETIILSDYWISAFISEMVPGAAEKNIIRCLTGEGIYTAVFILTGYRIGKVKDSQ